MRRIAVWAAAAGFVTAAALAAGGASTTYTHGYDVSWPQCSDRGDGSAARSMPSGRDHYLVLGLTHGAGHTVNPCLPAQLAWARNHHVPVGAYLVPSYPTSSQLAAASTGPYGACTAGDRACRLGNDGARQAADAMATMQQDGVPAPMVWIDVEFRRPHPWSKDHAANARVIEGVVTGLSQAGMPYGVYTTSYMWSRIVGGWKLKAPNWVPAGSDRAADAKATCRATGTGGATWLVQYTRRFDENLTCPAMDATPGHHGPLYRWRNTVLSTGSSGPAVVALQKALGAPAEVTGTYDDRTLAAVVAFQAAHLLPTDGRFDSDDWRALGAYTLYGAHGFLLPQVVAPVS